VSAPRTNGGTASPPPAGVDVELDTLELERQRATSAAATRARRPAATRAGAHPPARPRGGAPARAHPLAWRGSHAYFSAFSRLGW